MVKYVNLSTKPVIRIILLYKLSCADSNLSKTNSILYNFMKDAIILSDISLSIKIFPCNPVFPALHHLIWLLGQHNYLGKEETMTI